MKDLTILIPTYNRNRFSLLCAYNINHQDYSGIKEVIVMDDGKETLDINFFCIYPVRYIKKSKHMSIGAKRNALVKQCNTKYYAFMDDDDVYFPEYISHSLEILKSCSKYKIVGSTEMLFYFKDIQKYGGMSCTTLHLPHEATFVGYTKWLKTNKFKDTSSSEGSFLKGIAHQFLGLTDISHCMCCVVHKKNTISKNNWYKEQYEKRYRNLLESKIENHLSFL